MFSHGHPRSYPTLDREILERRFAALVRASAQIVWTASPEGMIVEDSLTWREFSGQTRDEFLGHGWLDAVHPEDRDRSAAVWRQAVRSKSRYETEYRLRHFSGEWRLTTARGYPVLDNDGLVDCWVGLNDDVTDQRAAFTRLEESEIKFRTLAETTDSLIWIADVNGQISYWNPAWYEYTGLNTEESHGLASSGRIHQDLRLKIMGQWLRCVETGRRFEAELRLQSKAGEYQWFLAKARPMRDSAGRVSRWFGLMTNIHAQREMANTLLEERRSRERFVGNLVHDLKNAFGTGKAAMSALHQNHLEADEREAYELLIIRSFARASRMVEDLLDANKMGAGHLYHLKETSEFSLADCARDVSTALAQAHRSKITVCIRDDIRVRWSQPDVLRILENLLSNAIKYGDSTRAITVGAHECEDRVSWWVHNWGPALPDTDPNYLFEFLARAPSVVRGDQDGWGIGLTLVKGLVEAHGGTIRVESGDGFGTQFTVDMPRVVSVDVPHSAKSHH